MIRERLFTNYSINERPVIDYHDNIKLKYGLELKSLNYFDQIGEHIKFNFWITQTWNDQYLRWNLTDFSNEYLNVKSHQIWIPDLELYNSASSPEVYDRSGGLKVFYNGDILWIRPTSYSFACKLNLRKFPFDKQKCTMIFGSWKYSANFLDLRPFNNHARFKNITVDPKFSHNEWNIIETQVEHQDIEYLCCPGELWPNSFYTITLKRNYTKYMVVIAMTLLITIASLVLITFSIKNYTRTFVLVFLPLPIIWLQIYIASKIPVIEYYTLMEKLLLTCFTINIFNAVESGIIFILIDEDFAWTKYVKRKIKNINNYKFIVDTGDEKQVVKYLININRLYSFIINTIFIVTISVFLA